MKLNVWFKFVFVTVCFWVCSAEIADADLDIIEIFKKYGYTPEVHEVQTEDGYLLHLHRLSHAGVEKRDKPPVMLVHGLMGSAENWMYIGPNKSLSYLLADHGYDVWLANCRGNMHSRRHIKYDPNTDSKYWAFSWHELGVYDMPANIDYILNVTGKEQVYFIGHSQGTTTFFVMASERPEYNQKVRLMMALAPSAFLQNMKNPYLRFLSVRYVLLDKLANALKINEAVPYIRHKDLRIAGRTLCDEKSILHHICVQLFKVFGGYDPEQLDTSIIPFVLSTVPAGASTRQALHYAQIIQTGMFRQYDFGVKKNMKRYNATSPPHYNLQNIVAPVALFWGDNDEFATKPDVMKLAGILPNLAEVYHVSWPMFTHMDFLWAKDVIPLVYNEVFRLMEAY